MDYYKVKKYLDENGIKYKTLSCPRDRERLFVVDYDETLDDTVRQWWLKSDYCGQVIIKTKYYQNNKDSNDGNGVKKESESKSNNKSRCYFTENERVTIAQLRSAIKRLKDDKSAQGIARLGGVTMVDMLIDEREKCLEVLELKLKGLTESDKIVEDAIKDMIDVETIRSKYCSETNRTAGTAERSSVYTTARRIAYNGLVWCGPKDGSVPTSLGEEDVLK